MQFERKSLLKDNTIAIFQRSKADNGVIKGKRKPEETMHLQPLYIVTLADHTEYLQGAVCVNKNSNI